MPANLIDVPGGAQVWRNEQDNSIYLVYFVPGTEPPVPIIYGVSSIKEFQTITGQEFFDDFDEVVTTAELRATGALNMGVAEELVNQSEHPMAAFESAITQIAGVVPWAADPSVLAVLAAAHLEGRIATEEELSTTDWWQNHSATERARMTAAVGDPTTYEGFVRDAQVFVEDQFRQWGIIGASDELFNAFVNAHAGGTWSAEYIQSQIRKIADPTLGELDKTLVDLAAGVETTKQGEDIVRDLVADWLGPVFGQWSDQQVADWAARVRNDPDAKIELETELQKQRLALLPEYDNPNLKYRDIAAPWKQVWQQSWGDVPDETDPLFSNILRLNDMGEAQKLLRSEGLKRGIRPVVDQLRGALRSSFGGGAGGVFETA